MEHLIDLPTGEVGVSIRGEGPPVVVFLRDLVPPTPNPFLGLLEEEFEVHVVDVPGFGRSSRPPWVRNVTQVATIVGHAIDRLEVPPCPLLGLGFGGWVAADLVTQAPDRFTALLLVSPWGVKPSLGEIADFVLFDLAEWAALGFHDPDRYVESCGETIDFEVLRAWDNARESVMAVAWKPIGHSRQLAQLLTLVDTPTLVAWGAEDQIVPASCASDWAAAVSKCTSAVLPDAGHHVDVEAPGELARNAVDFIRAHDTAHDHEVAPVLLSYFTEQPMSAYPEQQARVLTEDDHRARHIGDTIVLFSNKYFDRSEAARLYRERLIEYKAVEDHGFDAIMVNEHHGGPFCMNARCNITSAVLVAATERVQILQAGNPLPLWDNPVQLAEEIAMLDLISGGRIIAGMIRGGGPEQIVNDCNPVHNRERFTEAHDLIIKAWTTPGPFRWDGEHYQNRVVNPWVLPLRQPHPRIIVPGVSSPETIGWAASRGYPFLGLNTTLDATKKMWAHYHEVAAEAGFESQSYHRGYLMRVHVAETEEKAMRNAEEFLWMLGEFTGIGRPHWVSPTGYSGFDARMARLAAIKNYAATLQSQLDAGTIIAGTPEQVIPKIRMWLEETRPGILVFHGNEGKTNHADSMACIRMMGEEVLPAVREIGKELELYGPDEVDAPLSTAHPVAPTIEP